MKRKEKHIQDSETGGVVATARLQADELVLDNVNTTNP